jgi:hypothetical protein
MVSMPDKHSPDIYKASIMQILTKEEKVTSITPIPEPIIQEPIEEIITKPIEEPIEEEIIEKVTISKEEQSKAKLKEFLLNKY